jgi:hypothetical protein
MLTERLAPHEECALPPLLQLLETAAAALWRMTV